MGTLTMLPPPTLTVSPLLPGGPGGPGRPGGPYIREYLTS